MQRIRSTLLLAVAVALAAPAVLAADVPTVTKDELKEMLGSPGLLIVDARRGKDWDASEFKIQGAVRGDASDLSWTAQYPKDAKIVLYCA